MPEGDTIFRAAAAMHRALAGETVTGFDTGLAHLARVHDEAPLTGRAIESCTAAGKHLLVAFDGGLVLRTHMRMSGSWHLYRPGERWQRPARDMRIRIDTAPWVAVAFAVPVAEFIRAADLGRHRVLAALGPDLLSASFDRAEALRRLADAGDRPVADVLLDQRVVAGIGNIFRNEVLFACGMHPDRPASTLDDTARAALVDTARSLMRTSATHRIRGDEQMWVYGRTGKPCRRCGTPIAVARRGLDTRPTYWCPACQGPGTESPNLQQLLRTGRRPS